MPLKASTALKSKEDILKLLAFTIFKRFLNELIIRGEFMLEQHDELLQALCCYTNICFFTKGMIVIIRHL